MITAIAPELKMGKYSSKFAEGFGKHPRKPRAESDLPEIKITLVKSTIGRLPTHRRTVRSLGLLRIGHSVIQRDHPTIRGMINRVNYLVKVEPVPARENPVSV
jgi:large subunit ribosomal protein L30